MQYRCAQIIFVALILFFSAELTVDSSGLEGDDDGTELQTKPSSLVVIISPLVSLIRDQVKTLRKLGLRAIHFSDSTSPQQQDLIIKGHIPYVFMSPETAIGQGFKLFESSIFQENLSAIIVDESHCVVKWGQNSEKLKAFREEYDRLAELRSMVPSKVPVVALTATSTLDTRKSILASLSMTNAAVVADLPDRRNIKYSVVEVAESDPHVIFEDLLEELKNEGKQMPRTIIFCRSHNHCSSLYSYFRREIEDSDLFAMFHLTTDDERKEAVLKSFTDESGNIRILFATMAFGMGVNCKGVRRVYHFGLPEHVEDYVQESGRVGRDGEDSFAVAILYKGWSRLKVSEKMKEYVHSEGMECRRKFLMEPFGGIGEEEAAIPLHSCCDICTRKCTCGDDGKHGCPFKFVPKGKAIKQLTVCRDVPDEARFELENRLISLRQEILGNTDGSIWAGADLATGIPMCEIAAVVQNCQYVGSLEILCDNFNFFGHEQSIWRILEETLPPLETSPPATPEPDLSQDAEQSEEDCYLSESTDNEEYARVVLIYTDPESDYD